MKDPSRLLQHTGSLEAELLGALRDVEPPPDAHDQVWQRLGVAAGATAVGLAATAPLTAAAGAGTKVLTQTGWLSAIKWVALVGTLAPAAGVGVHWIVTSRDAPTLARPSLPVAPVAAPSPTPLVPLAQTPQAVVDTPPAPVPPSPVSNVHRAPPPSSLDAEGSLLRRAREKLENGDPKAALDDIALLASRFPHGELAQERDVLAIQALRAQGLTDAAASKTADFLRAHPSSPYANSLRQALRH